MIPIDLSEQEALDADPKTIKEVSFTGNLDQDEGARMFSIIEENKLLWNYFNLI